MRILCAIGARRGTDVVRQLAELARTGAELVLLHVIDTGPRHDLDRLRGPMHPHHEHQADLDVAEEDAAMSALKEAAEEAARERGPWNLCRITREDLVVRQHRQTTLPSDGTQCRRSDLNRHGRCHPPDFEARPHFLQRLWGHFLRGFKHSWCSFRYCGYGGASNWYGFWYGAEEIAYSSP
jgi:hypothetical protein